MKRLFTAFLMFILPHLCFSQPDYEDELVIHLLDYNGVQVTATATRLGLNLDNPYFGKWYPANTSNPNDLVTGTAYDYVSASNDWVPSQQIYDADLIFDLEGDENPNQTLSLSTYKISIGSTHFYVDILTSAYYVTDNELTFDYNDNIMYRGNCTQCTERIYPNDIVYGYTEHVTSPLEEFWSHSLYNIQESGYPLKIHWGPNPDLQNINSYRIYRSIFDSQSEQQGDDIWIGTTTSSNYVFIDNSLSAVGGNYGFLYKVKAFNSSGQSSAYSNPVLVWGSIT